MQHEQVAWPRSELDMAQGSVMPITNTNNQISKDDSTVDSCQHMSTWVQA